MIHAGARLERAKTMHITRPGGTDLTVKLGEYPTMIQYGFAESPGRFDHWGAGHVHTFPNEGSANGTVTFKPGDIVVLPYCRYVQDEVRLDIQRWLHPQHRRRARCQADERLAGRQQGAVPTTWTDTRSRTSAGGSIRKAAGTRSRSTAPTRCATMPARAALPAISCSQPDRTRRVAASAPPRAIMTCRCATARSRSTMTSSSSRGRFTDEKMQVAFVPR